MPVFGIQPAGLLQTIFEDIGTAVAVIDHQERVVFANRTAMTLFGIAENAERFSFPNWRRQYRIENALGHEISLNDSPVMRALKGERVESQELRVKMPDGTTKWILTWAYPFLVVGLAGVITIVVDQTDEVHLREATSQLQRMETLGALAAGLTHDLNNILDTISLNADLALQEPLDAQNYRTKLEQISAAARKASDLTGRLMRFSRPQDFRIQSLQVNEIIRGVLRLLHPLFRQNISVQTNFSEGLDPIQADRSQIEQVLVNVIVNALDAMPESGELTISTAPGDAADSPDKTASHSSISITVADTGPGIPPDLQPVIFEPFFTTKPAGKGTGLGLSTVQAIVRRHHGAISVRNVPGAGAAFTISLPVLQAAAPDTGETEIRSHSGNTIPVNHDR